MISMDTKPGAVECCNALASSSPSQQDKIFPLPPSISGPARNTTLYLPSNHSLLATAPGVKSTCIDHEKNQDSCECGGPLVISRGNWVCMTCGLIQGRQLGPELTPVAPHFSSDHFQQPTHPESWLGGGSTFKIEAVNNKTINPRWFYLANINKQAQKTGQRVKLLLRIREMFKGGIQGGIPEIVMEHAFTMFKKRLDKREPIKNNVTLFATYVWVSALTLHVPLRSERISSIFRAIGHRVSPRLLIQTALREKLAPPPLKAEDFLPRLIAKLDQSPHFLKKANDHQLDARLFSDRVERVSRRIIQKCKRLGQRPSIIAASAVYAALQLVHWKLNFPILSQGQLATAFGVAEYSIRDVYYNVVKSIIMTGAISIE